MTVRTLPWQEAQMLSVYFEESALYQMEQAAEARKGNKTTDNSRDMEVDDEIGGDDEIDLYEYMKTQRSS